MALSDHLNKSFRNLGPRNPLKKLSDDDKRLLMSLLQFYLVLESDPVTDLLEDVAKIAADAGLLGRNLQSKVFTGPIAEAAASALREYRFLPAALTQFSRELGAFLESAAGKPGHKDKVRKSQVLVMACEFVRQRTGKYYDEHFAELLQAIPHLLEGNDISGDSIRKKREYLKRAYPLIYNYAVKRVRNIIARSTRQPAPGRQ